MPTAGVKAAAERKSKTSIHKSELTPSTNQKQKTLSTPPLVSQPTLLPPRSYVAYPRQVPPPTLQTGLTLQPLTKKGNFGEESNLSFSPTPSIALKQPPPADAWKPVRMVSSMSSSPSSVVVFESRKSAKPVAIKVDTTGVTLKDMLTALVSSVGFPALFEETSLRCFSSKPSLTSSLKAVRGEDMEWARKKIEYLYIEMRKKAS